MFPLRVLEILWNALPPGAILSSTALIRWFTPQIDISWSNFFGDTSPRPLPGWMSFTAAVYDASVSLGPYFSGILLHPSALFVNSPDALLYIIALIVFSISIHCPCE